MPNFVLTIFSGLLILVGLGLGIREIRNPIRLNGVVRRTRRRLLGATLLCVLGGMIARGPLPQPPVTPEVLKFAALYWLTVMGLTGALAALALWDTWDGVRALNHHLDLAESRELERIQGHLKKG